MTRTKQGAGQQQYESTPTYEAPQPTFTERISMRLAGVAIGADRRATPQEVMTRFITTVGEYKPKDPSDIEGDKPTSERPLFIRNAADSTRTHTILGEKGKRPPTKTSFTSGNAFREARTGVDLAQAIQAENQRKPKGRIPVREKVARGLMQRAARQPRIWEQGRR
jgi:hypothetical protein